VGAVKIVVGWRFMCLHDIARARPPALDIIIGACAQQELKTFLKGSERRKPRCDRYWGYHLGGHSGIQPIYPVPLVAVTALECFQSKQYAPGSAGG
jgi:hypothetical protein